MQENEIGRVLIQWLGALLQPEIPHLYTHTPAQEDYPYGEFCLDEVKKIPGENRAMTSFTLTLFSRYRGQKELLEMVSTVRSHIENPRNDMGVFRFESADYKNDNDNITRRATLMFSGILQK